MIYIPKTLPVGEQYDFIQAFDKPRTKDSDYERIDQIKEERKNFYSLWSNNKQITEKEAIMAKNYLISTLDLVLHLNNILDGTTL